MQKLKTFLTVIGAVTILVLAANSAVYAATGGKFILGKTNKANKVSTLKRTTSGSALNLVTKSSSNAPMTVNGRGKVGNLNADKLDGKDSSAFAPSSLSRLTPVAIGYINSNGTIANAHGVTASAWVPGALRYEITLTGIDYAFSDYATLVSGGCNDTTFYVGEAAGKLVVAPDDSTGNPVQCYFQFVTYKLT